MRSRSRHKTFKIHLLTHPRTNPCNHPTNRNTRRKAAWPINGLAVSVGAHAPTVQPIETLDGGRFGQSTVDRVSSLSSSLRDKQPPDQSKHATGGAARPSNGPYMHVGSRSRSCAHVPRVQSRCGAIQRHRSMQQSMRRSSVSAEHSLEYLVIESGHSIEMVPLSNLLACAVIFSNPSK